MALLQEPFMDIILVPFFPGGAFRKKGRNVHAETGTIPLRAYDCARYDLIGPSLSPVV